MFLSKILYDSSRPNVSRDLSDCHQMHRTMMSLFPNGNHEPGDFRAHHGVLFRIEGDHILLQSKTMPDVGKLKTGYSMVDTKDMNTAISGLTNARVLGFRLDANPSKRLITTRKREALETPDEQCKWLDRRGQAGGFKVHEAWVSPGLVSGKKSDGRLSLASARFDGILEIVDAAVFRRTIEEGIGQGKSYGLGLLTVRRS